MLRVLLFHFLMVFSLHTLSATIAIIDTGFDLDHDFLKLKISDSEMEAFDGWNFHDNSHLKTSVIEDPSSVQEILRYRTLKAKGHREGLTIEEFDWYKKKSADKEFMEKVKKFKKHAHGTFVAGIALREGENINIFPIRGLNLPNPVLAVEVSGDENVTRTTAKTSEEKFQIEIQHSLDRVTKKFSKICRYLSAKNVDVVNASYGITQKHIVTRFREKYKEIVGTDIPESKLQTTVNDYFAKLYERGEATIKKYPKLLFVFSAGNSGLNNDLYHHYPSRIKLPNTISVAALNGEYIASFSNFGLKTVDVAAPGVAILSLVPKVYSQGSGELYSPSSGTSMAAPYISNLAAQILNANPKLGPEEVRRIILETGDEKAQLKGILISGSAVNNQKALKAALLSRDMVLTEAINFAKLNLFPMEDEIRIGMPRPVNSDSLKDKMLDSLPKSVLAHETDDVVEEEPTKSPSSSLKDQEKQQPDSSSQRPSPAPTAPELVEPRSIKNEEQSPPPSEERPASSSPTQSSRPEDQSPSASP